MIVAGFMTLLQGLVLAWLFNFVFGDCDRRTEPAEAVQRGTGSPPITAGPRQDQEPGLGQRARPVSLLPGEHLGRHLCRRTQSCPFATEVSLAPVLPSHRPRKCSPQITGKQG